MDVIRELHIKQLHFNMNIGCTEPKYAVLDDGTQAIVKLANGVEGNLVLYNEYICYRLAILVDLPMPISGYCIMDENTEIINQDIASVENFGYAFYSTYMPKTTKLLPSIIGIMKNKEDFIKILLFDHIIFNRDRNEGNLLVRFYKNDISLKVIDHSHVFINESFWESSCLERAIIENDLIKTEILECNQRLYEMFYRVVSISSSVLEREISFFQNKLNRATITNLVKSAPIEWTPSKKDTDSLINYIMYRVDNLNVIKSTILNYLK